MAALINEILNNSKMLNTETNLASFLKIVTDMMTR